MTVAYTFTECLHTNRCCAQRRFRSRVRATEKRSSATFFEHSVHQDLSGGDVQNVPQKLFFTVKRTTHRQTFILRPGAALLEVRTRCQN